MAIHHGLQTVRAHYEPLDDIIHRQAHPTQSSNVPIRHTIIHNKIRKFESNWNKTECNATIAIRISRRQIICIFALGNFLKLLLLFGFILFFYPLFDFSNSILIYMFA